MRIYVSSSWGNRDRVAFICDWLAGQGHHITSTWHSRDYPADVPMDWWAPIDLAGIDKAEAMLAYTEGIETECRGAMDFEAGYAFGIGKRLFWIGPDARNVFLSRYGDSWPSKPAIPNKLVNRGA